MKKCLILLGIACVFALTGCITMNVALFSPPGPPDEVIVDEGEGNFKILLLDVDGIITSAGESGVLSKFESPVAFLKERLELAREDSRIKAVVLRVNSPGGGVTASDIMYKELVKFKKDTGIPIVACFMDIAASGGYYISMAADRIICHPTCITGSIGVIAQLATIDKLLEKVGIEPVTIKSGKHKDIGSPMRVPTDEEKKIMQKLVDSMYERFVKIVAQGRGMEQQEVRAIADGRVHDAQEALKLKLVDKVGYLDDAIETAQSEAGIQDATVVMYTRPGDYRSNIYSAETKSRDGSIGAVAQDLLGSLGARFYYLWVPGK